MPATIVALIRGINVGTAKRVAMADLRAAVEGLGYSDVRTLLNSGNLVFTAPRAAAEAAASKIEKALSGDLGVSARVIGLTAAEFEAVVSENSLDRIAEDPARLLVAVFGNAAGGSKIKPLLREDWAPEALALGTRAAYLWCPEGQIASPLFAAVSRTLGPAVTTRNWSTVLKLQALVRRG